MKAGREERRAKFDTNLLGGWRIRNGVAVLA